MERTHEVPGAVVNRQVAVTLFEEDGSSVPETGLTLGSFTVVAVENGSVVASPVTALSMALTEVHSSGAPGEYRLTLTPAAEGELVVRLARGTEFSRWVLRPVRRGVESLISAMEGGTSRVKITTENSGSTAVPGVLLRIYAGDTLVAQGISDSSGEAFFDLSAGTYTAYLSKQGYDFTGTSPATLVVPVGDEAAPVIDTYIPGAITAGTVLAVKGRFFDAVAAQNTLNATDGTTTATAAASAVDVEQGMLLVTFPAGLATGPIRFWLTKPNPNAPPADLLSNVVSETLA